MKIIFLKKNYNMNKSIFFIIFIMLNTNVFGSEAYFDLSEKEIQIQTNFNGKEIIVFGILESGEDTIVSIKGPRKDTKMSKKERILGFWFNTKEVIYKKLPSLFFISSSSPIKDILNTETIIKDENGNITSNITEVVSIVIDENGNVLTTTLTTNNLDNPPTTIKHSFFIGVDDDGNSMTQTIIINVDGSQSKVTTIFFKDSDGNIHIGTTKRGFK